MRKSEIEQLLTRRLKLKQPTFLLKKAGAKWSGSIISDTFRGKTDSVRQEMIWDALDAEFGPESIQQVGTILAYTQDEWAIDLPAKAG